MLKLAGVMLMIIDESTISVAALLSEIENLEKELNKKQTVIDWYQRINHSAST